MNCRPAAAPLISKLPAVMTDETTPNPTVPDAHAILSAAKHSVSSENLDEESESEQRQRQQQQQQQQHQAVAAADELEAAPLHLHTLREPALLRGSGGPGLTSSSSLRARSRSRSTSRSRTSSRDVSPAPSTGSRSSAKGSSTGHRRKSSSNFPGTPADPVPGNLSEPPSHAGTSSLSGYSSTAGSDTGSDIDPDILLDRLGFDDLEPPAPHSMGTGELTMGNWGHSSQPLPSLNERMSEESLDDTRAFQDLVSTLHTSLRSNMLSEEIAALGALPESVEEDRESDEEEPTANEHGAEGAVGEGRSGENGSGHGGADDVSHHPAVQVLDDLLAKVHDPEERAKLLRLKRDHSDKIEAAIRGVAQRENLQRRASAEGGGEDKK